MKNKLLIFKSALWVIIASVMIFAKWEKLGLEGIQVTAIDMGEMNNSGAPIIGTNGKGIYLSGSKIMPFYTGWLDTFELFVRTVYSVHYYSGFGAASPYFTGTDSGLCHYFYMDRDSSFWGKISEPSIESVKAIISDKDTLFIAIPHEIYKLKVWGIGEALNIASFLPTGQKTPFFTSLAIGGLDNKTICAGSMLDSLVSAWTGVIVSEDNGKTWQVRNNGLIPPVISVYCLSFCQKSFNDTNTFFLCGTDKGIFYNTTGTNSWARFKPGVIDNREIRDLHVSYFSNSSVAEVFVCTDSGAYLLSGYPNNTIDQAEWQWLGLNKKMNCACSFVYDAKFWLVGTDDGLYKYSRENIGIKEKSGCHPRMKHDIKLSMLAEKIIVYMNSPGLRKTRLGLFDSKGRSILKNIDFSGALAEVNTNQLPEGVYYIHLQSDDHSSLHRIVVIK